jgi:hypothetical protein
MRGTVQVKIDTQPDSSEPPQFSGIDSWSPRGERLGSTLLVIGPREAKQSDAHAKPAVKFRILVSMQGVCSQVNNCRYLSPSETLSAVAYANSVG